MKSNKPLKRENIDALLDVICKLDSKEEARAFIFDLCTPAELEALSDRWAVVPYLVDKTPYRTIHERTGVSVTTITRVARSLSMGYGGYATMLEKLNVSTNQKD